MGIFAQNQDSLNGSLNFEFTNLYFKSLNKGIYVNAQDIDLGNHVNETGIWQFDNVKLNFATFNDCNVGVHVNSNDSGWTIGNIDFLMAGGAAISPRGSTSMTTWLSGKTIGFLFERISYSSINLVIGNSLGFLLSQNTSSAFFYIEEHAATVGIRNSVDEGFDNAVYIDGNLSNVEGGANLNVPIQLENNTFQSQVFAKDVNLVSIANHFNALPASANFAVASGASYVYSYGDKFCVEDTTPCANATYATSGNARIIQSTNQFRSVSDVPSSILLALNETADTSILKLGVKQYFYNISRDKDYGTLDFTGNQGSGYSGYNFETPGGTVKLNNDGSVTYGSKNYTALVSNTGLLTTPPNGTVVYCSDCQKATPCSSGGSGALAKRISSNWDCD